MPRQRSVRVERGQGNEGGHTRGGSPRTSTASKVEAGGGKGLACKKKKCTQNTMRLGEGTQGQVEGFICTPQALGRLWNFFCSRDLTRSILHGKPHPQLTCGEMLGKEFNTHLVFLGLPLESPPRRSPSGSQAAAQVRGNLEKTPT